MKNRIRETLTLLALLIPTLDLAINWQRIPATIPIHFALDGTPNGFGSRNTLWLLPAIAFILYVFLHIIARLPHTFNLPQAPGTPRRPQLEAITINLLAWLRLQIVCLFGFLTLSSVSVARHTSAGLPIWFTPVTLVIVLGTTIYFIWRLRTVAAA